MSNTLTIGHCTITDDGRRERGELDAFDDAAQSLRNAYERTARGIGAGRGAKFHLTLTLETVERIEDPSKLG